MAYDSREIANYLLDYATERSLPVTNMVLLKIVYFAHAQHLHQYNRPLTDDVFEAWERGPVVKTLYDCFKKFGAKPITEKAKRIAAGLQRNTSRISALRFIQRRGESQTKLPC